MSLFASFHAGRVRKLETALCREYDAIIAAVPHIAGVFRDCAGAARLHVVYNYTTMQPDRYPDYDDKTWDAIYTGLMNNTRGGMEIIRATAMVREKIPDVRVLVVGPVTDPAYYKGMKTLISTLGVGENIEIKQTVPYDQIMGLLLKSRIGLGIFMPLSIFRYGIQVKTFEYMICGLPVICSNSGNINDIISGSNAGICVDPESPREIANAILKLLTDRQYYDYCSQNGIHAVREKYNWTLEERKLIGIYRDLMGD